MPEVLHLGGRLYRPAEETTFAQDAAFMALVYETKVHDEIAAGGDIIAAVLRSGRVPEFLACSLVPLDGGWTADGAKDTAAHFAALTDRADKATLMTALSVVITGFFGAGGPSATNSPSASTAVSPESPADRAAPHRRRRVAATGARSSPPLPTTTGAAPVP